MNKKILSIGTTGILIYCGFVPVMQTNAAETETPITDEIVDETAGLIAQGNVSISESNGNVSLSAWTRSSKSMYLIGLKNISVERSSNGVNWTQEKTLTDKLKSNANYYSLSGHSISVTGGYYYRITCDHYAEDSSGTSQSVSNTSNSVWID